ncbi:hypothetical protein EDD85DRAFT_961858 [Armillaria nabsnona]|nr:hypothetical protein EDD85DRAFT_961858 [Armillaria nabsnona]
MAADRMSKKAKVDRGLSHSPNPITSLLVWDLEKKEYWTFDYYPLISNETDDWYLLNGWNACIATDASGDPLYQLRATGKGTKESMIVILKQSIALRYPGATLKTFHHNNILLSDTKTLPLMWSLDSLTEIGNIDLVREVQAGSEQMKEQIYVNISLCEMYEEGLLEEGRILNALSLPCNTSHSGHPLQLQVRLYPMSAQKPTVFRIISSHIQAFEQTSDLPTDIYTSGYPVLATSFWLVATKGAISYIHSDCFGVGTVVEVLCRQKLWCMFQRCRTVGNRQDSYINEYMGDWASGFIPDLEDWTSEVVLLEPGSAFYMHPNTHHAVVTLENSIIKGHHFYSTATLLKTVLGWVHMCMLGYSIMNVLHTELLEVLLCMMCYFGAIISDKGPKRHDTDIPSLEREGLLDLIMLGNLCLFVPALYTCICDEMESSKPAIAMAAGVYISIIQCLRTRYCLIFFEQDAKAAKKASGVHESLWIHLEQFQQDIKDAMGTFLQMELTSEFINAYKQQKVKHLLLRPTDLTCHVETEAMMDWTHILDFDPSDNEEDDNSDNKDSDSGKPSDGEAGNGDLDSEKDITTNLSEEDAMYEPEDANSQISSELMSEGGDSRDECYCP